MARQSSDDGSVDATKNDDDASGDGSTGSSSKARGGGGGTSVGGEEVKDRKRKERLEQNRISARESRKRKKTMIEELQRTVITLSRENKELNERNESLRRQLMEIGTKYPSIVPLHAIMGGSNNGFDQQAAMAAAAAATGSGGGGQAAAPGAPQIPSMVTTAAAPGVSPNAPPGVNPHSMFPNVAMYGHPAAAGQPGAPPWPGATPAAPPSNQQNQMG